MSDVHPDDREWLENLLADYEAVADGLAAQSELWVDRMRRCTATLCKQIRDQASDIAHSPILAENDQLKAENAELKKRLDT